MPSLGTLLGLPGLEGSEPSFSGQLALTFPSGSDDQLGSTQATKLTHFAFVLPRSVREATGKEQAPVQLVEVLPVHGDRALQRAPLRTPRCPAPSTPTSHAYAACWLGAAMWGFSCLFITGFVLFFEAPFLCHINTELFEAEDLPSLIL